VNTSETGINTIFSQTAVIISLKLIYL